MDNEDFLYSPVCVIGLGYVGLPLLLHLGKKVQVIGFDVDKVLIENLNAGLRPNFISEHEFSVAKRNNNIEFTSDPHRLSVCKVIVVCVPTPLGADGLPDFYYLHSAVRTIIDHASNETLVISESTSYPGTLREIFQMPLQNERINEKFFLATAPERIDPGNSIELESIPRVVGGIDEMSTDKACQFYSRHFSMVHSVTSPEVAEMSKLLENTFRQVNISFVNELNQLCRATGIDTHEVIEAAATKPYGFMKFSPGPGIGGHCIPVDPEYLQYFARRAGNELAMVRIASQINLEMGNKIFERISEKLDGRVPSSVLIAGVSYKSNIPDVRDTPAKAIIQSFRSRGILTSWHDPLVSSWAGEHSVEIKSGNWEVGIIVTAHDILDIKTFQEKCQFVFDCTGRFHSYSRIIQI